MIRHASIKDIDDILAIKDEAVKLLKDMSIDQWQDGYPNRETFGKDIENSELYVYDRGYIRGFFALVTGEDEAFKTLEGTWESKTYLTLHRIAVSSRSRGEGLAHSIFNYCLDETKKRGLEALRVDTHKDNGPMNHLIQAHGFSYRGLINKGTRLERRAYEKLID